MGTKCLDKIVWVVGYCMMAGMPGGTTRIGARDPGVTTARSQPAVQDACVTNRDSTA